MKEPKRQVVVINYNTPELTEAAILSLRKHGGLHYDVTVFDNSDARPFKISMPGVKVMDNTAGKIIDFDKILETFPNRNRLIGCSTGNEFGSVKHILTVNKLWEMDLSIPLWLTSRRHSQTTSSVWGVCCPCCVGLTFRCSEKRMSATLIPTDVGH